jgi:hypothetical protein
MKRSPPNAAAGRGRSYALVTIRVTASISLRRSRAAGPTTMRTIQALCGACRLRCSIRVCPRNSTCQALSPKSRKRQSILPCCGSRMIIIMGQPLWQAASFVGVSQPDAAGQVAE